jgi:outer membrane receptor protein involved in Fe transport
MYWNMDYARSAGVELTLLRKLRNFISGSLSYTYIVSKGKNSDPNATKVIQETGGDAREPSLEEEFLWWNRPHKLTAQLNLRIRKGERPPRWLGFRWPRDLSIKLYYRIRSGRPYTPMSADGRKLGVNYSRNGPYDSTCDVSITKGLHIAGRRVQLFFNVYNLFDYRTPLRIDSATGQPYELGIGSLADEYPYPSAYKYEEAYYRYHTPSDYAQARTYRTGIRYDW